MSISAWLTNLTALTDLDGPTASEPGHSGTVRGGGGYRGISANKVKSETVSHDWTAYEPSRNY